MATWRRRWRWISPSSLTLLANVSSWPIDLLTRSASTGRSSIPSAYSTSVLAIARPTWRANVDSSTERRSLIRRMPRRPSLSSIAGPTPHSERTPSVSSHSRSTSGVTIKTPGPSWITPSSKVALAFLEPNLAKSLLRPRPMPLPTPISVAIRRRSSVAASRASTPSRDRLLKSPKASSRLSGSKTGVKSESISKKCAETSSYRENRPGRMMRSGQWRRATTLGIAEYTPRHRAS